MSGVAVYRDELRSRRTVVARLLPASIAGGICGALLLLSFPGSVFTRVVPWLVGLGTVLVLLAPTIRTLVAGRRTAARDQPTSDAESGSQSRQQDPTVLQQPPAFASRGALVAAVVGAFVLGTYGGYFSAAQGILLIGLLGIISRLGMQELNAIKNLTVLAVNVIAATVFMIIWPARINWPLVGCIALGAVCGGTLGGRFAKRLSAGFLRGFVVVVGVATSLFMLLR